MFLNDALPAVCVRLLLHLLAAVLIGLFVPYYIVFYAPHRGADAVQKTGLKEEVLLAELNKIIRNHR